MPTFLTPDTDILEYICTDLEQDPAPSGFPGVTQNPGADLQLVTAINGFEQIAPKVERSQRCAFGLEEICVVRHRISRDRPRSRRFRETNGVLGR